MPRDRHTKLGKHVDSLLPLLKDRETLLLGGGKAGAVGHDRGRVPLAVLLTIDREVVLGRQQLVMWHACWTLTASW